MPGCLFPQVSVDLQQRNAKLPIGSGIASCASAVIGGIRPLGGSTIFDVRAPVRFVDKNTPIIGAGESGRSRAKALLAT